MTVVEAVAQVTAPTEPASLGALQNATTDVSHAISDLSAQSGVLSILNHPTQESQGITNVVQSSGVLRIIFNIP